MTTTSLATSEVLRALQRVGALILLGTFTFVVVQVVSSVFKKRTNIATIVNKRRPWEWSKSRIQHNYLYNGENLIKEGLQASNALDYSEGLRDN